jgi:Carboxypeptidase regulatory-like domain
VKRSLLGAVLLCIVIPCSLAFGQSATTSLRGVVKDPSGALIPGATVAITDKTVDKTLTAVTNSHGDYQFPQIPPATYIITVTAQGLGSQSKSAELLVNQPATIDFTLSIQTSSVTVDVSASAQTLNTTDASMGNSVGNAMIQTLPMDGRDPVSLLALQPGVLFLGEGGGNSATGNQEMTDSRQGAVSGSRSDQGNIVLDGLDDNDQLNGYAFTGVLRSTLDSTEEFRVTTSNGSSDSGRSSGAQISLITKKGTNKYHGAAYEYYRPTNTVSNNWFLKNSELASGQSNTPAKYLRNVFGASAGGPIKKDKLFFFANYEALRQAIDDINSQTVPTAAFQAGTIQYYDSGGNVDTITAPNFQALDSACTANTFNGAPVCPWGPGANPNVLSYYGKVPVATGSSLGDGLNSGSLFFPVKVPTTQNTSIFKLDYNLTSKQQVFARGNLQKDTYVGDANLPGQGPSFLQEYNTKGLAFGHTWTPTANIVNDVRYGYVRQGYGKSGLVTGDYINFRFLVQPTAQTFSTINDIPVHNITDTFTWTKGNHTVTLGGNWRLIQNINNSNSLSFNNASTNPYWLGGAPPDPSSLGTGLPAVDQSFENSYVIAYASLVGTVPQLTNVYNYKVSSPTAASILADGAAIDRHFKANEYEWYVQDSWRIRPSINIIAGLRHSILQTPYEVNGQEIAPTIDTDTWFKERQSQASQGIVYEQNLDFSPAGKANNQPGYWPKAKDNFAPRLAVVWSPNVKTSIRAGAGIYFDHYGEALVNNFSQNGSFGLSTSLTNQAGLLGFENAPRFTTATALPSISLPQAAPTATFPYEPPAGSFLITYGVDNHLKTPYSEAFNLSFQRELPGGFTFEEAYVGRLGRHLLEQLDLAEPVNFNDPQGGGDYFTAAKQLSHLVDVAHGNPCVSVPKIPFFEDVFSYMAGFNPATQTDGVTPNACPTPNASATQAVYTYEWATNRYLEGETTGLANLDFYCGDGAYVYNCPAQSRFWQSQFSSMYSWASIGTSSYNALQATLRHPKSRGVSVDFSYTFSKSIDLNSGTERANWLSLDTLGGSAIQNTWNPKLNRAVSDFDTRHLITGDLVWDIPVGRGKRFLGNSNMLVDSILGGWTFGGLSRWTSGLPFSLFEPGWSTDWNLEGYGQKTGTIKTKKNFSNGQEQVFANVSAINSTVETASGPMRLPYPGEAGSRNVFRGDGYFDIDNTLSKVWKVGDIGSLKFDGEVYNITNSNRFDTSSLSTTLTGGSLGAYGATLPAQSNFRRMQFGLRFDF